MTAWNLVNWMALSLAFYAVVAVFIGTVSRNLYPKLRISAVKRRLPKLNRIKFVALFFLNSIQTGLILALALAWNADGKGPLFHQEINSIWDVALCFGQFLFVLLVFDTQYYWLHRLFHKHKTLYRWLHAEHHEVRYPNVWHLHYQSPLEWFLTSTSPMLLVAVSPLPIAFEAYFAAVAVACFINVAGHAGFEITGTPIAVTTMNGWASYVDPQRRWIARLFNNVLHHDLHHQRVIVNFSLYFTVWDRLCGSMDQDSDRVSKFSES